MCASSMPPSPASTPSRWNCRSSRCCSRGRLVVPLVVGDTSVDAVERVLATLWGGPETLIVVSSDLSHYHDYEAARSLDLGTSQAIEVIAPARVDATAHAAVAQLPDCCAGLTSSICARRLGTCPVPADPAARATGSWATAPTRLKRPKLRSLPIVSKILGRRRLRHTTPYRCQRSAPRGNRYSSFPPALRAQRATFVTIELGGPIARLRRNRRSRRAAHRRCGGQYSQSRHAGSPFQPDERAGDRAGDDFHLDPEPYAATTICQRS